MKKTLIGITLLFVLLFSSVAFAAEGDYGEGDFGDGDYSEGTVTPETPSPSGSSGGGGSTTINQWGTITEEAATVTMNRGSISKFKLGDELHSVRISSFSSEEIKFTFRSVNKYAILKPGETAKIDMDSDETNDLEVTLVSIAGTRATLTLKEINETITETDDNSTAQVGDTPLDEVVDDEIVIIDDETDDLQDDEVIQEPSSKLWLWIIISLIVVIIVIVMIVSFRKKDEIKN